MNLFDVSISRVPVVLDFTVQCYAQRDSAMASRISVYPSVCDVDVV